VDKKKIPKVRKYFCWLLGHRYAGVADPEVGCVYCGYSKPSNLLDFIRKILSTKEKD